MLAASPTRHAGPSRDRRFMMRSNAADILDAFPDLQPQDIAQALHYAAESVREREIPIRAAS